MADRRTYLQGWRRLNRGKVLAQRSRWNHANLGKRRVTQMRYRYGLEPEEFDTLLAAQDGRCAICREAQPLKVDHDHETGAVRGLLCNRCNVLMGALDDREWREKAEAYRAAVLVRC